MWRSLAIALVLLGGLWVADASASTAAHAATFVVNADGDEPDTTPGDGSCLSTPSGLCTLRAAVMEANALSGADNIQLPAGTIQLSLAPTPSDDDTRGDVDLRSEVTIVGAGRTQTFVQNVPLLVDVAGAFEVHTGASVRMENLTIRNSARSEAPGVVNRGTLTLDDVEIKLFARDGVRNEGTLTGSRVYIRENRGTAFGVPVWGFVNTGTASLIDAVVSENGHQRSGGGIANSGSLTLNRTTLSGNGIGLDTSGTAVLTNATISRNSHRTGTSGILNTGDLTMTNVTLASNDGYCNCTPGIGLNTSLSGVSRLKNTIVANNGSVNPAASNCAGPVVSLGNNIDSGSSCGLNGPGDRSNVDARVGPPPPGSDATLPVILLEGSPAIDNGSDGACPTTDQLGAPRPVDGNGDGNASCDIGAYELQTPYSYDLRLAGTLSPDPVLPGGAAQLLLDVTNVRPAPAPEPVVTITLPSDAVITSARGIGLDCTGQPPNQVVCRANQLADLARASADVQFRVGQSEPRLTVTAVASGPRQDATPDDNRISPSVVVATRCQPRPPVQVQATRIGPGLLRVTVEVQDGPATPTNVLRSVRLGTIVNAAVLVNGQRLGSNDAVPVAADTRRIELTVDRDGDGRAVQVPLVVTDACGDWPTFVGGGPASF